MSPAGLEPAAYCLGGSRSIHLSYGDDVSAETRIARRLNLHWVARVRNCRFPHVSRAPVVGRPLRRRGDRRLEVGAGCASNFTPARFQKPSLPTHGSDLMVRFVLNGRTQEVDVPEDTPLLWVLRDSLKLTGTKFGCGISQCGACTVHVDGQAVRSCQLPISAVQGARVTTIEGLDGGGEHPVQRAWVEEQVPQCGYCQSGQIMSAAALLREIPAPTDDDIDRFMSGNICRCGAYGPIRRAIHRAADLAGQAATVAEQVGEGAEDG